MNSISASGSQGPEARSIAKRPPWTHLVFSGGGFSGLAYMGILRLLETEGIHQRIHHVTGTSIGAIFATFYALRISAGEIEKRIKSFLKDGLHFPFPDIFTFWKTYGIQKGHRLTEIFPEIEKLTFLDIVKRTGVHLVICATHVQTMESVYFSVDTTPNVLVYDALRASMAIPGFSEPILIGNDHYIDGGITDNIPVTSFENVDPMQVLVIHIAFFRPPTTDPMNSIGTYALAILQRFFVIPSDMIQRRYRYFLVLRDCPVGFFPATFREGVLLEISEKQIDDSIIYGYQQLYEQMKTWSSTWENSTLS